MEENRVPSSGDISRRKFVSIGAAGAGLAALMGISGCTPVSSDSSATSAEGTVATEGMAAGSAVPHTDTGANAAIDWDFLKIPEDIPESEISNTEDWDVLVIGSGFSGVVASTSAAEQGAKTLCIDKGSSYSCRGAHITAFGSKVVKQYAEEGYFEEADYAKIVRRLIEWAYGRVKEPLIWQFAMKSGACMDWLCDLVEPSGLHVTMWAGYYKGPDYTEVPVTHFFYDDTTDFIYLDGVSHGLGMDVLVPAIIDAGTELGCEYRYDTPCVRLLRESDGACTGAIVGEEGNYTKINAKSVVIAAGDYVDDDEMRSAYIPISWNADTRIYMPGLISTGDLHKQALWIGAAMQESWPHACGIHLESGAQSYNFLHVNANGERFMNEDVNTQSKSVCKEFQPDGGKTFTIYDANSVQHLAEACENGLTGGISCDQQYRRPGVKFDMDVEMKLREAKIEQGLLFQADSIEELAEMTGLPADTLQETVDRYNELVAKGSDDDFGKRPEIMWPIDTPPYFAGQVLSTLLHANGGLRTDPQCHVLDENNSIIDGLFVCGGSAGQYFAHEYPTICPGHGHGRCLTFGHIAGINAAGGDAESEIESLDIPIKDPSDRNAALQA